jgi:alpha(1,3/1,4) fucosyltransferase
MLDGTLKLSFSDFWSGFDPRSSFLWPTLSDRWSVELAETAPLLVYGPYSRYNHRSRATKLFCTGEPDALPSRFGYDYALSWHLDGETHRHARVPSGVWNLLKHPAEAGAFASRDFDEWAQRPHFCNFIYSNAGPVERRLFFAALSKRRFTHSPGVVDTNTEAVPGGRFAVDWWQQKIAYQRQFRFTIAFENKACPGYTSEKLIDALLAGTIPIYWGNPDVSLDVDPRSFVNASSFRSWEKLADYLIEMDDNRDDARSYFKPRRPLLIDLNRTKTGIVTLFEHALVECESMSRRRHAVRPWLIKAERAGNLTTTIVGKLRSFLRVNAPIVLPASISSLLSPRRFVYERAKGRSGL